MLADNHGNASSCGRQAQLARRRLPAGSQCCHRPQGPPPGASRDTEAQRHLSPTLGCLLGMEIAPCLYQHEGPQRKGAKGGGFGRQSRDPASLARGNLGGLSERGEHFPSITGNGCCHISTHLFYN